MSCDRRPRGLGKGGEVSCDRRPRGLGRGGRRGEVSGNRRPRGLGKGGEVSCDRRPRGLGKGGVVSCGVGKCTGSLKTSQWPLRRLKKPTIHKV